MQWVIDSLTNQQVVSSGKKWYQKKRLVSDKLKYCNSCKSVWENDCMRGSSFILYYEDFPSHGLKRINCRKCNEQEI